MSQETFKKIYKFLIGVFAISIAWYFFKSQTVDAIHPFRGEAIQAAYATGNVESSIMLPIATRASARLLELNVDEGDFVKKDQILAKLENQDLESSLAALIAKETFAKSEYERNRDLFKNGATSKQAFDLALSNWQAAQAQVTQAKSQASYMNLSAPNDGVVIKRDGEIGQLIPANQAVFWLAATSPLRISAEVDEEDIAQVQLDQEVLIRADAFPRQIFNGIVKAITPKGDPIARSYRVRIELKQETPLKIGMTTEVNIILKKNPSALLIPSSAVNNDTVWRIVNSRLELQKASIGIRANDQLEILDGLSESDLIVSNPNSKLKVGQKVSVNIIK